MSKRVRTLVLAGIAVLVLVALLLVLLLVPQEGESGSGTGTTTTGGSATKTSIALLSKETEGNNAVTVKEATFTIGDDSFTLVADKDGKVTVKGFEKLPHNTSTDTVWTSLLNITATRMVIESPANPADFGFDKEDGTTAVISATYSDDTTFSFELGDDAPSGEGRYVRVKDKPAVYLMSTYNANTFTAGSLSYLSTSPITVPTPNANSSGDTAVVRDVELSGSVRPEPIFFQVCVDQVAAGGLATTPSGYIIRKPFYRGVSIDSPLIEYSAFSTLSVKEVVKALPTDADLKEYGLDNPYSVSEFNLAVEKATTSEDEDGNQTSTVSYYNVFKYTVKLGKETENGLRYAVVYSENELIPIVYLVNTKNIQWAEAQYDDIADTMLFYVNIKEVTKMTITAEGVTTAFNLTHLDVDTSVEENLVITAGSTDYKADNFRALYSSLMSLYRDGSFDGTVTGDPMLTLEIQTKAENATPTVIKLYRHSAGKYVAAHNTGETYLIGAKSTEALLTKYQAFLSGKDISAN